MALRFKIVILLLLSATTSFAALNSCLDKNVSFPQSNTTLKLILKSFSDQTGCTFSYNPILISDSKPLKINDINNISLAKALRKVLPVDIQFTLQGKYILLQKIPEKIKTQSSFGSNTDSNIDKNPKKVALVIPVINERELYFKNLKSTVKDTFIYILPSQISTITLDTVSKTNNSNKSLYTKTTDSSEVRRLKTEQFLSKNVIAHLGFSSSSPLSSVFSHIGMYGFYGIFSVSTDYNNSYRMGYGLGYSFSFRNTMGVSVNIEQNTLFAGESYNLGVRATLTHIDPLITFDISRDFTLFIGPSLYMSKSSYVTANTDLGTNYGVGALIGVKFNLISALLAKK